MENPSCNNPLASYWLLDPGITFLNHGSFGACPVPVLEKQQQLRFQLERQPLKFFIRDYEQMHYAAKKKLADFVNAPEDDIVFVPNVTHGVNTVLKSLTFDKGEEILTTSHEYPANRNALDFLAKRTGVRIVVVSFNFPLRSKEEVIDAILSEVTPRTRLALVDHVTSPTGLVLPVEEITREMEKRGVDVMIDGAHALGMLPLDIESLGAAYYSANAHKWLCSPKGSAFLYVKPERQKEIHPLAISHAAVSSTDNPRSLFQCEFFWTGTNDPTACLCIPEAIRFMGSLLPGGWTELMERNRKVALEAREVLCNMLDIPKPCPDEMIGTLCSVPIPAGIKQLTPPFPHNYIEPLQDQLYNEFRIEVPVMYWPEFPQRVIRTATQIYNIPEQYEYLAQVLKKIL